MSPLQTPRLPTPTLPTARLIPLILASLIATVSLTALALSNLLIAGALIYAAGYLLLAWRYPGLALLMIFAAAPFQNDLSSGGSARFSIAEINLMLTLPVLYAHWLRGARTPHVGPIFIPVLLYFAVCAFSSFLHWQGDAAVISLVQMFLYFVVAVMVFCVFTPDSRQYYLAFYALVWVGCLLAIAGLATHYWFVGLNKNGIAESLSCSFLVGVELFLTARTLRRRQWLGFALLLIGAGLLFSLSRGSWLGTVGGVVFLFALRRKLPRLLRFSLMLLPLLAVFWFTLPQPSRDYATGFGRDRYNINLRYESMDLAENYFHQSPIYGMGVGLRKNYDATNVLLMTLAETGVLGLAAFLLIHAVFFQMIWKAQTRIAPSDALFSLLCVGGALVLNKFLHGLVDHYWSRGAIMCAWAAAGMATRAYYVSGVRAQGRPL